VSTTPIPTDNPVTSNGLTSQSIAWLSSTHPTNIKPDEVHLCLLCTNDLLSSLKKIDFAEMLSLEEQEKAAKLRNAERRSLYNAGRIGLRMLIHAYTDCPIQEIQFAYGTNGKPELVEGSGQLQFNYSVSSGHVLYAFSITRELGVDLEIHPRNVNVKGLSRRILSPIERELFNQLKPSRHNSAMLDYWTRKEAYGKLLGVGIRYNMKQTTLIGDKDSTHWCTMVSGLFEKMKRQGVDRTVCGVQIGLPIPGSASLMYNVPDIQRPHPNIRAYRWSMN